MGQKPILLFCLLVLLLFSQKGLSQHIDSNQVNRQKALWVGCGGALAYGGTLYWLSKEWYSNYPQSRFHWFNDNSEWLQIDKVGHAFSSYQESRYGIKGARWIGLSEKKAVLYGGMVGFLLQAPIEILDGFSSGWGASWGDLSANAAGAALITTSEYFGWGQKLQFKFGFRPSSENQFRKNLLGRSLPEQVLKDYNGQSYWLSVHPSLFVKKLEHTWPEWLHIGVGYGVRGLIGAKSNVFISNGNTSNYSNIPRARQYYLSLDLNLAGIRTKKKWVKQVLELVSTVRVPFPALQYDRVQGLRINPWGI